MRFVVRVEKDGGCAVFDGGADWFFGSRGVVAPGVFATGFAGEHWCFGHFWGFDLGIRYGVMGFGFC